MSRLSRSATTLAVATALCAVASTAQATPPPRQYTVNSGSGTTTDLCGFPVTIAGTVSGVVTTRDDGTTTTLTVTGSEQDTISANDVTLTGMPYKFHLSLVIDDNTGNVVGGFATGVAEKIPLPDGGLFITAGRVDEALHANDEVVIVPDVGNTGDVGALCASLH